MRSELRRGFTLIEAILGLTLGAVVLLNARLLVGQSVATRERFDAATIARDSSANGLRVARRLLANAHSSLDTARRPLGTSERLELQSWCEMPEGFARRCNVQFSTRRGASTTSLYVNDGMSGPVFVAALIGHASLAYLYREARDTRWASTWRERDDALLGVAFASMRDTVTFALQAR